MAIILMFNGVGDVWALSRDGISFPSDALGRGSNTAGCSLFGGSYVDYRFKNPLSSNLATHLMEESTLCLPAQ